MKKLKSWLLALPLIAMLSVAHASQNPTTLPTSSPYPGLTMLNNINSAFDTFQTNFSGASAPSGPKTWQTWVDTSNNLFNIYNGTSWLPVAKVGSSLWVPVSNGVPFTAPSTTGSANAYVLTYAPVPTGLVVGQHYSFMSNFQNTSTVTLNVNSLGAKAITKQGAVALASHDIANNMAVDTVWDGAEFQMVSQLANASAATVTSVATSNGVCGGPITTSGTVSLCATSANTLLANITAGSAVPVGTSLSAVIDTSIDNTQGDILYRSGTAWTNLTPGTSGQVLTTAGPAANPTWMASGAETPLQIQTASNSGSIVFLSVPGTYNHLVLRYTNVVPATNGSGLDIQLSANNGSSWNTTNNFYQLTVQGVSGTIAAVGSGGLSSSSMTLTGGIANLSNNGVSGTITITGFGSSNLPYLFADGQEWDGSTFDHITSGGGVNAVGPYNAIRLIMSSGNIASGTFTLYGIKNQ